MPRPGRAEQAGSIAARNGDRPAPGLPQAPCLVRRAAQVSRAGRGPGSSRRTAAAAPPRPPPAVSGPEPGRRSGSRPRSQPARNTTSNSRPLAAVQGQQRDRLGPRVQRVGLRAQRDLGPEPLGSSPHRRASGASTSPAARTSEHRRVPLAARRGQRAHRRRQLPGHVPRGQSASGASRARCRPPPGRRASRSCDRFWYGSPARVSACAERAGLRVGPVQHGDVGQPELAVAVPVGPAAVQAVEGGPAEQLVDRGGDPGRLGVLVRRLVEVTASPALRVAGAGGRGPAAARDQRGRARWPASRRSRWPGWTGSSWSAPPWWRRGSPPRTGRRCRRRRRGTRRWPGPGRRSRSARPRRR